MLQTTEETELTMPSDFRWHSFLVSAGYLPDTKGMSVSASIGERLKYAQNDEKTEDGEYISSYACDPKTADEEFMLSKQEYS